MKTYNIHFYENRWIYYSISISIVLVGLICNIIFGTKLDISFKGGAALTYSYSGNVDAQNVEKNVEKAVGRDASVNINTNVRSADNGQISNNVTISFAGTGSITPANQDAVLKSLQEAYPKEKFESVSSNSVNASMGQSFFLKCIVAILIAFVLLNLYIAARFRKIGGMAAGFFAIFALLHDVSMVYFTFIISRMPLDDNFIAVVLTILGYSLNDTIVIYDRIRENRKLMGPKTPYRVLVNTSINQTLTRSINTAICTFLAIATVFVVGSIYHLNSVVAFALPMMVGVVTGCYSTVCIAGPMYVSWENHKMKKKALAAGNVPAKTAHPQKAISSSPAKSQGSVSAAPGTSSARPAGKKNVRRKKGKKRKR